MGTILQFSQQAPAKFGFEKARTKQGKAGKERDQLNLFAKGAQGHVLHIPSGLGPFEEALHLDERGDAKATVAYHQAIEAGDSVADAFCNLGILEYNSGNTAKAFDCFTQSLKHDPRHLESHFNLGNMYFEESNFRLARMHYEFAIEVDSSFANIYFNLGLVLALLEEFGLAEEVLARYKKMVSKEEAKKADQLLSSLRLSIATRR